MGAECVFHADFLKFRGILESRPKAEWSVDLSGAFLAATYQLYKKEPEANALIRQFKPGTSEVSDYGNYYDAQVRDAALLYLLAKHFPKRLDELGAEAVGPIVQRIAHGSYNTVSSAYSILALDAMAEHAASAPLKDVKLVETLAGGAQKTLDVPPGLFPKIAFDADAVKLKIQSPNPAPVYYQITQAGFDRALSDKELKNKLEVFTEIQDDNGTAVTQAKVGEQYQVHVRARSTDGTVLPHVAVVSLIPSGFDVVIERTAQVNAPAEPAESATDDSDGNAPARPGDGENEGGEGDTPSGDSDAFLRAPFEWLLPSTAWAVDRAPASNQFQPWSVEYVDHREDRVLVFGTVTGDATEYVYKIQAVSQGKFRVPPPLGESMYDRSIQARGLGGTISVEGR